MPRALIISADGFEDVELLYPYYRLVEAGFETLVAAPERGEIRGKMGYKVEARLAFDEVKPEEFDVLVIPGGRAPERVRLHEAALNIVRHFFENNKPVATICHGPQVLISAGVVKGRRLTSFWGVKDDVIAAGGNWVDEPVVVDGNLVSSRYPPDIPFWMREFIRLLESRGLLAPTPVPKA
ncbi:type 1 glutamine amidotransferase domain-containing protein [Aeropyrum camini]|uniref:Protease n=1 Tax=Aeropyrum camini SY1 = JCM 12091 TaxID=1198449 RepID=U3TCM5_9CREN|nr:type 1 glutamine amidotransferase domain-containing protein [Aeropyrum camini]BAN89708.1 protease [Aeropyrum camini SY1 = JCM 12091]